VNTKLPLRPPILNVLDAVKESGILAQLTGRIQASQTCLRLVKAVLPTNIHLQIQAGPVEDGSWCLLTSSAACSAKLRQLTPTMLKRLQEEGLDVKQIRIKVIKRMQ